MKHDATVTIIARKLDCLKPHPQQKELFPPLSDIELQCLADDLKKNGLRYPAEILPDGTIVCGHQRVAAAKLLGWAEIDCIVRHDLAAAGNDAIERHLIDDNLNRRQLAELDIARIYRHLKERRISKRTRNGAGDWRDNVGKRFGMTGRTLARWAQVLDAVPGVQQALSQRMLNLTQAIKVASLPPKKQQEIVVGLAAGKKLNVLAATPGVKPPERTERTEGQLGTLLTQLCQLTKQVQRVSTFVSLSDWEQEVLDDAKDVLLNVIDDATRVPAPSCGEFLPMATSRMKSTESSC